jgi:hypothetical protein
MENNSWGLRPVLPPDVDGGAARFLGFFGGFPGKIQIPTRHSDGTGFLPVL